MANVIIVSAPVQKVGFGGFSNLVRPLGRDRGFGLGLDKK